MMLLPRAAFAREEAYKRAKKETQSRAAPSAQPRGEAAEIATMGFEVAFVSRQGEWLQVLTRVGRIDGRVRVSFFTTARKRGDRKRPVRHVVVGPMDVALSQTDQRRHMRRGKVDGAAPNWLRGYYDATKKAAKNKRRKLHVTQGIAYLNGRYFLVGQRSVIAGLNVR